MSQYQNSPFQYLMLGQIVPSPTNKRRIRQDKLQELADNIKANGVMQPILVRPIGKDGRAMFNAGEDVRPDHYEIVAGERRWRASQLAGETSIPAMVRELLDLDALQLQVFENLHRDDLHPMEEAEAFDQLLKKSQDLVGLSVDELALKVHKSRSYVYASLKLLDLCTYARDAFFDGKIGKETSILIARIPGEKLQTQAVKEIIKPDYNGDTLSFRAAKAHIRRRYTLELTAAPWDLHNKTLVPEAGSCFSCPKRSGNSPEVCADIESPDVCTDPDCYTSKKIAHVEVLKAGGQQVIEGAEAKEIAPYGLGYGIQKGYASAERHASVSGVSGSYRELLGDDLPEPTLLVTENHDIGEVYLESDLKAKLQQKIDAGELVVEPQKPREPSEWEIKRQAIQAKQEAEESRRRHIFEALNKKLGEGTTEEQQRYVLRLALAHLFEQFLGGDATGLIEQVYGHDHEQGEFINTFMQSPATLPDLVKLFTLALAAGGVSTGYGWEGPEDSEGDEEFELFSRITSEFGLDPAATLPEETTSTPHPAAQAVEQTREVDDVDEAPDGAGQASETPEPATQASDSIAPATAEGGEPNPFDEIKAKALAKKARRQKKEGSAAADANQKASAATATEETTEVAA